MTRRHHIDQRRVYFDLETGGKNPRRHPVTQIGAVAYDSQWQEVEAFEVKLSFDEADCDADSLKKHHYDRRLWQQHGVEPITALRRFAYFLREHSTVKHLSQRTGSPYFHAQLVAFNANFDRDFLFPWHDRTRREHPDADDLYLPADWHVICVYQAALRFFDQNPTLPRPLDFKLGTLCHYFRLPYSVNESHDALYDARRLAELDYTITAAPRLRIKAA